MSSCTQTSRSISSTGSGRSRRASTRLKITAVAPIPSPIVSTETRVTPLALANPRIAYLISCQIPLILSPMPLETTSSASHPLEPRLLKRLRRTRRLITHDLAIEEVDRAVGMASITRVVRDHTDRRTPLVQLPQQLHHPIGRASCRERALDSRRVG